MNMYETIMRYIDIYGGSEQRIIENTVSDFVYNYKNKTEAKNAVINSILWLLNNNYIKSVNFTEMIEDERRYYSSDDCAIYRVLKRYNEKEYYEQQKIVKEEEDKLSIIGKFILYFTQMEDFYKNNYFYAKLGYKYEISDNCIRIEQNNDNLSFSIDLNQVSNVYYDKNEQYIYYKYCNENYIMQFVYFSSLITINNYKM